MPIHPRNQRYKDRILTAPYEICVERARLYTQSYRETEGEPPATRAAKAFAHTVANMEVRILEEEQIVGHRSSKLVSAVIPVERGDFNTVLELELDALTKRERQPYRISPEEKRELEQEILPYWRGKTVRDRKKALWKANGLFFRPSWTPASLVRRYRSLDVQGLLEAGKGGRLSLSYLRRVLHEVAFNNPAFLMNIFDVQGHFVLGHKNVLRDGFAGIRARAGERMAEIERQGDEEGRVFLEAVIMCCDAMAVFAGRFADEAERVALETEDAARAAELRAIADRCRRVPYHAPRDFREAVQAMWLTQAGAAIAYGMGGVIAAGRMDQWLYPFYAKDQAEGRVTAEEAVSLMEELLLKLNCNLLMLPSFGKRTGSELGSDSCVPTIGGLTKDGHDGVNELSHLILDAFTHVKATGNGFSVRLSRTSPDAFWRKALETYRHTSGAALFSDEAVVGALKGCGTAEDDARDYAVIGCVEPTSDGDTFGCTSGNDVSLVAALEMALLDGYLRIMGRRIGPRTGNARTFTDFRHVMGAFKEQAAFLIRTVVKAVDLKDEVYRDGFPNPYISATLAGCVEHARDVTAGGATYNYSSVSGRGLGTLVDSLAAIRRFVFEERSVSMGELLEALESNFEGHAALRLRLAGGPKYGSDDDGADDLAQEVLSFFCNEVSRHKTIRGGCFRPGFFSYGMHVFDGMFLGATPNGRYAGEPVSNSLSPSNGAERKGPTALMRSVAKMDHGLISNGCALNVKFLPGLFDRDEDVAKMAALVKGYFAMGGMEVQPNVVSNEELRHAQAHPEQHRDLVVRVSGYSAYFTDLGRPLQDEIIARTEFGGL